MVTCFGMKKRNVTIYQFQYLSIYPLKEAIAETMVQGDITLPFPCALPYCRGEYTRGASRTLHSVPFGY